MQSDQDRITGYPHYYAYRIRDYQRTYNDVQQNYYQSLFNYAAALVNLERSAGIWDIQ